MKLPTWKQCDTIPEREQTPLERFIYENEPAGSGEEVFRALLQSVIDDYEQRIEKLHRDIHHYITKTTNPSAEAPLNPENSEKQA